ncbi:MAG: PilZ domain-containing protein [Desulfotalea sp.]
MKYKLTKSYVSSDGIAIIVCPNCFIEKSYNVSKYIGRISPLKIKCKCAETFHAKLEFRKFHRKEVSLEGNYFISQQDDLGGPAYILDISEKGIGFEVRGMHSINIGDEGKILFTLDNKKKTQLEKTIIVRAIKESQIGCEFTSNLAFERELGFYMRM